MPEHRPFDAAIIGGNIRGLVAAYVLGQLGYRTILIERAPKLGGVDGSFQTPGGTCFDHGLHVLDENRSELATKLFTHVVDGEVHRTKLERAIVLRNEIIPYAPSASDLPPSIRSLLPAGPLVDDIGTDTPTRERLARSYGDGYADLILDEVLPSYPTENRHRAFGVEEGLLLRNIYPWFFPRAERQRTLGDESRAFHDKLREGIEQYVLYPKSGGFSGFAEGFAQKLRGMDVELLVGASDTEVRVIPGTHRIDHVSASGRRIEAHRYFWASAWPGLCKLLGVPCQDVATDVVMLGSFVLNQPANTKYHEILLGDPTHRINRLYFPSTFARSNDARMQVEFSVPKAESWPLDPEHWRSSWLDSLRRLGVLGSQHEVIEFDFKSFALHFNAYGMEGEALVDADPAQLRPDSNIHPIVPSMANLNLNAYVPRVVRELTEVLAA